jgi:hypothetical protein
LWVKWKLVSVCLEIVLISAQQSCTVHAKHTIGWDIILDTPMVLLHEVGQVETHCSPFGDSLNRCKIGMVCAKCGIGLEIILGAPHRTPRCRGPSRSLFRSVWR